MIKKIFLGCVGLISAALITFYLNPDLIWNLMIDKSCLRETEEDIKNEFLTAIDTVEVQYEGHRSSISSVVKTNRIENELLMKEILEFSVKASLRNCEDKNYDLDHVDRRFFHSAYAISVDGYKSGGVMTMRRYEKIIDWLAPAK